MSRLAMLGCACSCPARFTGGDRKYLYLNLSDTPENWELAQAKAQLIESDIRFERFDPTLKKYKSKTHLTVVETIKSKPELTLTKLFERYLEFKKPAVKPTTFHYLVTSIQAYINRYPTKVCARMMLCKYARGC